MQKWLTDLRRADLMCDTLDLMFDICGIEDTLQWLSRVLVHILQGCTLWNLINAQ